MERCFWYKYIYFYLYICFAKNWQSWKWRNEFCTKPAKNLTFCVDGKQFIHMKQKNDDNETNSSSDSPFSGNVCSIQRGRMVYFQIVQYATLFVAHETVIKKNAGFGTPLEEFMLPGTWKPTLLLNGWKSWFPTLAKYLVIQFVTFLGWWVHVTLSRGENVTSNDRGWKGHELNHLVKMCFIIQLKQPLVSCPYKLTQMTKNFLFGWYNWHKLRQLRLKFLKPPSVVFNPVVNPFPDAFVNSHHQLDYWTPEDFIQFTPKFQVDKWPNIFER